MEETLFHQNKLRESLEQCSRTLYEILTTFKVKTKKIDGVIVGQEKLPTCSLKWLTHANELWAETEVEYQQVGNCLQQA